MSAWYRVKNDDIDIVHSEKEVTFYVHSDEYGSVYLILPFYKIKEIANKIDV